MGQANAVEVPHEVRGIIVGKGDDAEHLQRAGVERVAPKCDVQGRPIDSLADWGPVGEVHVVDVDVDDHANSRHIVDVGNDEG
jgi:hypothetical protein